MSRSGSGENLAGEEAVRRALSEAVRAGAHSADVFLAEGDALEARVRGDTIDFVKQARERTLGIRAFVQSAAGLRCAVTSTSDLSPEAIDHMAAESVALARASEPDPYAGLPEAGFAAASPELSLLDPADRTVSVEARIEEARRAERAARELDPRIVNSEGSAVSSDFSNVYYANTAGFLGAYESAAHSLFSEPVARENGRMQRDYWMTVGRRLSDLEEAASVGRSAARRAVARLGARSVPTCKVPVVFEPLTARSLLAHLLSCISGYPVYRQTSYLAGSLGKMIASEAVTVIDDGTLPGALGSRPFDGEGLPTRRTVVVEDGRLSSYLLDSYSARKLDLQSTGNATRTPGSAPGAGPSNLWLEPGSQSAQEIVAGVERGLLVTELMGMGFNAVTGDYSRGAAGFWIEDGRVAHPVEEVTIAGNLADMLSGIDAVGSDLLRLGRVAAPTVRVARMTVAGA